MKAMVFWIHKVKKASFAMIGLFSVLNIRCCSLLWHHTMLSQRITVLCFTSLFHIFPDECYRHFRLHTVLTIFQATSANPFYVFYYKDIAA